MKVILIFIFFLSVTANAQFDESNTFTPRINIDYSPCQKEEINNSIINNSIYNMCKIVV